MARILKVSLRIACPSSYIGVKVSLQQFPSDRYTWWFENGAVGLIFGEFQMSRM